MKPNSDVFRSASHLPPLSVCLLLAAASVLLLCSRTESAGDPDDAYATALSAQSSAPVGPLASADERRVRAALAHAGEQQQGGMPEAAVATLRRAVALAESARLGRELRTEAQHRLAACLDAAGDHEAAIEVWWQLLSTSSRHDDVARRLAASLAASGRTEEAQRVLREMLHVDEQVATLPPAPVADHSASASSVESDSAR